MFNIGDKIVYPMHGAGTIDSIEEKNILGETQKYYKYDHYRSIMHSFSNSHICDGRISYYGI